eukprot:TRINITY_DN15989_c0_g1_i1.p1 TRINITY_DN15989_c0_g1~~TRINITY_DN15989_c0_g1_i1.p1  ORF type:complete len:152 (-),score=8.80 TRINITY_DN15989_c0_g1_i1:309-764(-)
MPKSCRRQGAPCCCCELEKLIVRMAIFPEKVYSTENILELISLIRPGFVLGRQEDAVELLTGIIEASEMEGGFHEIKCTCDSCHVVQRNILPLNVLELSILGVSSGKEALARFTVGDGRLHVLQLRLQSTRRSRKEHQGTVGLDCISVEEM